jgi:hypothetical protein
MIDLSKCLGLIPGINNELTRRTLGAERHKVNRAKGFTRNLEAGQ